MARRGVPRPKPGAEFFVNLMDHEDGRTIQRLGPYVRGADASRDGDDMKRKLEEGIFYVTLERVNGDGSTEELEL